MPGEYFETWIMVDSTICGSLNWFFRGAINQTVDKKDTDDDNEGEVQVEDEAFEGALEFSQAEMHQMYAWWEIVVVPVDLVGTAGGCGRTGADDTFDLGLYGACCNIECHL